MLLTSLISSRRIVTSNDSRELQGEAQTFSNTVQLDDPMDGRLRDVRNLAILYESYVPTDRASTLPQPVEVCSR